MSTRHDDPASRPGAIARCLLAAWLIGSVALAGLPLAVGVVVSLVVPSLGGTNPSLPVWIMPPALLVVFVVALVAGSLVEQPISRLTSRLPRAAQTAVSETVGIGVLWLLLRPLMADGLSAWTAALVTVLLYLLTSPVVEAMEARRPGE